MSDVGNVQVIDMLKEKISAGATKIRRYEERELHYHHFACNNFTRNLMVVVTFQIKLLMLQKLLNFGAIFGPFLEILMKMVRGSSRSEKG